MKLRITVRAIALLLLIVGVYCLLFKPVKDYSYNRKQTEDIEEYAENFVVKPDDRTEKEKPKAKKAATAKNIQQLQKAVMRYNKRIYKEKQVKLGEKTIEEKPALELSRYGIKDNIYGYVIIEKINLKMPIILGATTENMALGAVHVTGTSIPYGGANTNAVIAGHCGYAGCNYFRYIETLSENDEIRILTPFGKREYKVTENKIIEPSDLESIKIRKGKDMITLFTCYPYPTSRYRICVFGEAV